MVRYFTRTVRAIRGCVECSYVRVLDRLASVPLRGTLGRWVDVLVCVLGAFRLRSVGGCRTANDDMASGCVDYHVFRPRDRLHKPDRFL